MSLMIKRLIRATYLTAEDYDDMPHTEEDLKNGGLEKTPVTLALTLHLRCFMIVGGARSPLQKTLEASIKECPDKNPVLRTVYCSQLLIH